MHNLVKVIATQIQLKESMMKKVQKDVKQEDMTEETEKGVKRELKADGSGEEPLNSKDCKVGQSPKTLARSISSLAALNSSSVRVLSSRFRLVTDKFYAPHLATRSWVVIFFFAGALQ